MSNLLFRLPFAAFLLAGLIACGSTPPRETSVPDPEAKVSSKTPAPVSRPPSRGVPLTPDVIYAVLVGEIAAQRGQLPVASAHYRLAAALSQDPATAERSARIAVLLKDEEAAEEAVRLWVSLEPENPLAHQIAATLYARSRKTDLAIQHLRELVRLSRDRNINGFMQAVMVVGKLKDQKYGLELMRELAAAYGDDPKALYSYAVVAAGAGEYDLAESSIRRVLELEPDWAEASVLLSRILLQQGKVSGALAVLREAVEDNPDSLVLRVAYARQLVEARQLENAYEQFVELLKVEPASSDLLFSAGIVALQLGNYDAARRHLKALTYDGTRRDEAMYYLGQTEEMDGNPEAAAQWYAKVSGNYQREAQVRRARLLAKSGQVAGARDLIQALRVQEPDQSVRLYLIEAEILREAGRADDVMQLYAHALKYYPNNADLLYDRALYAVELGRLDILERDLRQIIQDDPDHADALNALGYTLADQTSRYDEALEYIERALALKPDNAAVLDSMGWVQYRLGNNLDALRYLRRALELQPDAEIAAHLGEVLWVTGDREEAIRVWKASLAENPDDKVLQRLMKYGPTKD